MAVFLFWKFKIIHLLKSDNFHHRTSADNRERGSVAMSVVPGGREQVRGRSFGPVTQCVCGGGGGTSAKRKETEGCLQRSGTEV